MPDPSHALRGQDADDLLRAFFDSAPFLMGVVEHRDGEVRHQAANQAALDLFRSDGATVDRVEGATFAELGFTEDEAAVWERHVRECGEAGRPVHFSTAFPWGAEHAGEGVRSLDVVLNVADREASRFSYVVEDVTERRRPDAERRLLAAAVEQAAEPIVVTDVGLDEPSPRILYANAAHARTFGYTVSEILGQSPRMFQGSKTERAVLDRVRARLEAGEAVQAETVNYRKDGSEFVLQWEIAPVRDEDGVLVNWVGTQRDVTEQRRLEREILEVAAREQERMARDLHDGLGQVLTGAAFRLQALHNRLEQADDPELAADALRSRELVEDALGQARAIARGLFPINTEPDGLAEALARLATDAELAFGIVCSFDGPPVVVSSREHAAHLYRIAQEAMANAARHGRAGTVEIALAQDGGLATLTVCDDGVGIPDAALAGGEGLGLRTMRYRADRVGGEFEVRPKEGGGTVVAVTFPAAADEPAD
ncbi:PAS domain S-box protein [Rubrivirga sp.]|uniref:PAS domain-containing sensor histidine kinase n=1 Tax=Rubrivirga sp. TaxID=1885344 RepID=UPI003B51EBE0